MPGRGGTIQVYSLVGEEDEPFHAALTRAVDEPLFAAWGSSVGDIEVRVGGTADWALIPIDRQVTLGQVAQFAGDEPLPMTIVGRGGGVLFTLLDYLNAGLTLAGVATLLGQGHSALNAVLWRHQRAAARRWLVAGTDTAPQMDLVQYVRTERYWSLKDFATSFDLGVEQSATLLRRLGYEPTTPDGIAWQEPKEV